MDAAFDGISAFLAVSERKSFTAAAAALGVTPTAVSQKIKLLEQRLDAVLFQRTTRRVALTEAGEGLYERLRPAVASVEAALGSLAEQRGRPTGTLRLSAPRSIGQWLITPLLAELGARYPELGVEVSLNDAFIDLVAGGFDAGIRLGDSVEQDMVRVPITRQSAWAIVGSPSYLKRAGRPKKPEDLLSHRAIRQRMISTGVVYRWELERAGKPVTVDVPGNLVVDEIELLVALAREGLGLAYVPEQSALEDLKKKRLERVLEDYLAPGPGMYLYFPARTQAQSKLRALIEVLKALEL